jgi:hypothetical protein
MISTLTVIFSFLASLALIFHIIINNIEKERNILRKRRSYSRMVHVMRAHTMTFILSPLWRYEYIRAYAKKIFNFLLHNHCGLARLLDS